MRSAAFILRSRPVASRCFTRSHAKNVAKNEVPSRGIRVRAVRRPKTSRIASRTSRSVVPIAVASSWSGDKIKTRKLDEVKHSGEQNFNYEMTKTPIHLTAELQIIDSVLEEVTSKLTGKDVNKVLLVSDHGASRLAVINEQECKWEMASKGQHSGRCCPCCDADVKSQYATQENGFWVLANYDRFKGGRKASVEVHGGATLEEVVIPLIEFELYDKTITVTNETPTTTTSFKKNAEIIIFSTSSLKNVSVRVAGRHYEAEAIGHNKHKVEFDDIKKTGKYAADVFEGDNLIGQVEFEVQRESGKTNDSDWFN